MRGAAAAVLLRYAWLVALVGARAYEWISAAQGYAQIYLRSVVFGGAAFIVLCTLPILAKWVLIGRWKPQQIRIWSLAYFRFWIVKTLVRSNPLVLGVRRLAAVHVVPAGAGRQGRARRGDLLPARAGVHRPAHHRRRTRSSARTSFLNGYRAHAGWIQTGPVTIGRNVFIGEKTVLDIDTSMGDVSQLGHASSLHSGQRVPDRRALARVPGPAHRR